MLNDKTTMQYLTDDGNISEQELRSFGPKWIKIHKSIIVWIKKKLYLSYLNKK